MVFTIQATLNEFVFELKIVTKENFCKDEISSTKPNVHILFFYTHTHIHTYIHTYIHKKNYIMRYISYYTIYNILYIYIYCTIQFSYTYVCVCVCVCVYIYIYIYIYIYKKRIWTFGFVEEISSLQKFSFVNFLIQIQLHLLWPKLQIPQTQRTNHDFVC